MIDLSFYKGKRVLLTGHTGFKGAWMSKVLCDAGAKLTGYALARRKRAIISLPLPCCKVASIISRATCGI